MSSESAPVPAYEKKTPLRSRPKNAKTGSDADAGSERNWNPGWCADHSAVTFVSAVAGDAELLLVPDIALPNSETNPGVASVAARSRIRFIAGVSVSSPAGAALNIPGIPANARFPNTLPTFAPSGYQQIGSPANTASSRSMPPVTSAMAPARRCASGR